ncbi:MAG: hypothetical protein AB1486_32735 [Planctomycetota bacterium]
MNACLIAAKTLVVLAMSGALVAALSGAGQESVPPLFRDAFDGTTLTAGWGLDVSTGNTVALRDGALEIHAAENTYAHVERALGADHVRASAEILPSSGISWCVSLFLYWAPGDWCQFGVIPRGNGRYYACVTTRGQRAEYDLARCRYGMWHRLAIELAQDGIRFLTSADGATWRNELFVDRPQALMGAPALLVVGKGFGVDAGHPDLDSDYGEHGAMATGYVRNVLVVPTPPERLRISSEERREREALDEDPLGRGVLARTADPDYETVAALLPALAQPREVVGVKDHRYEIGVDHDGTIQLGDESGGWEQNGATASFELGNPPERFGAAGCRKKLARGSLPIVIAQCEIQGLRLEQSVLGYSAGMSADAPLSAYVELRVTNPTAQSRTVDVTLRLAAAGGVEGVRERRLDIKGGGSASVFYRIPAPLDLAQVAEVTAQDYQKSFDENVSTWTSLIDSGMRVSVPEQRVNDAYRAWLAYNFIDADKIEGRFEPHDGAGFYESIFGYSAVLYASALDLWGFHKDSRRYLESMLSLQKEDGLFFENYGLPDHGALLLAVCEHYRMTRGAEWFKAIVPRLIRMAEWIAAKRAESVGSGAESELTRGLIRFTPYCDYPSPTFNFYADAYCCIGLERLAQTLDKASYRPPISDEEFDRLRNQAERWRREAKAYRDDILAAMNAAQFERDGKRYLPIEPDTRRLLEGSRYEGGGYYGLVASMLLESEFLPPFDERAALLKEALEKRGGLILGMCEFAGGVDHAYTYGYWLNCLRRDEVRRVILGFYGSLAYGMGRDTYCGVEVTQLLTGEPTPTMPHLYSGTQQLRLLRMMLVHEEGSGELVIGHALPGSWLAPGKCIEVRGAPTWFGPVSFTIEVDSSGNRITLEIDGPARTDPDEIRIALRHPGGRPLQRAAVEGRGDHRMSRGGLVLSPGLGFTGEKKLRVTLEY